MFLVVSTYKINKSNLRKTKDDGEVEGEEEEEGEEMLHGKLKMHINLSPSILEGFKKYCILLK